MMHRKRLAAVVLSLSMAFTAIGPAVPALAAAWERNASGSYVGSDGSTLTGIAARGIDVSHWKQAVDWNAVAADDISFVMLGTRYNNEVDPYFDANARGASSAGLRVGAYLYSYATTTAMAEQEADFVLNLIKDYPISYPVVMDVEASEMSALTPTQLADIINAFCKKIETAGYYPMLYTNDYWLSSKIDMTKVHYDVWAARYDVKPAYQGAAMWQATNQGEVNGITGSVDINFALKDFTEKLPANRWRLIADKWYYYKNYVKQTGWINDGQSWYYLNADGTQYKGWLLLNNNYYYLLPKTGQMQTGWTEVDKNWYYLNQDGTMAREWLQVDGKYYYLLNGAMVTGWLRIGSDYYYLRGDGSLVMGWRKMDNAYYYFESNGKLVRGWADIEGKRYFLQQDGTMVTGWQTIDNVMYYFNADGSLATKWTQINGYWYYFGTDGKMMTGWIQLDGRYYYLHTDGRMVTGWQNDGTNKYYMDPASGKVSVGWKQIDKAWYFFNQSGHMITGWLKADSKYYYLNPSDGKMVSNGSYTINNVNYTFDKNGVCQNEASAIDGGSAGSVYNSPAAGTNDNVTSQTQTPGSTGAPGPTATDGTTPGGTGTSATTPGGAGTTVVNPGNTSDSGTSGITPGNTGTGNAPGGTTGTGTTGTAPGGTTGTGTSTAPGGTTGTGTSTTTPGGTTGTGTTGNTSGPTTPSGTGTKTGNSTSDGLNSYQTSGPK